MLYYRLKRLQNSSTNCRILEIMYFESVQLEKTAALESIGHQELGDSTTYWESTVVDRLKGGVVNQDTVFPTTSNLRFYSRQITRIDIARSFINFFNELLFRIWFFAC